MEWGGILDSPRCLSVRLSVRPSVDKVSGTFWKNIGSIHFIHSIYPYGLSLLTPIHFPVPSLVLALWWPNIWPKMGFRELFEKTIGPIHFIPGIYPKKIFLTNSHLCSTRLHNRNLYWIFLDEVSNDQSGSILSPFMGTACSNWRHSPVSMRCLLCVHSLICSLHLLLLYLICNIVS